MRIVIGAGLARIVEDGVVVARPGAPGPVAKKQRHSHPMAVQGLGGRAPGQQGRRQPIV